MPRAVKVCLKMNLSPTVKLQCATELFGNLSLQKLNATRMEIAHHYFHNSSSIMLFKKSCSKYLISKTIMITKLLP